MVDGSSAIAHGRASGRTVLIGVTGFGAAALVTSFSVLAVDSSEASHSIAAVGGTAVLGVSALFVAACSLWLRTAADRVTWAITAVALALTTAGSGVRSSVELGYGDQGTASAAEGVYLAGVFLLLVASVLWPWLHRRGHSLTSAFAVAVGGAAGVGGAVWLALGRRLLAWTFAGGELSPAQLLGFLGVVLLMIWCAFFALASGYLLRDEPRSWAQLYVAAGVLAVAAGDLTWLYRVVGTGWVPGSLGDFAHLAGHVLIAVAASLTLDISIAERAAVTN